MTALLRVGRIWPAELSGCRWFTSAVCGEYARKLLPVRRFRWSRACNPGTVNPSRKLRRFESFTCHHVPERASELRKRGSEALVIYLVGVSRRCRFGDPQSFGSQACELRKRVVRIGWR